MHNHTVPRNNADRIEMTCMPISDDDYNRYIAPILNREDIWQGDNVLVEIVTGELTLKVSEDNRMEDFTLILMELIKRRKQILEEHPNRGYSIEIDDEGNPTGEIYPIENPWFL